MQLEQPPLPQPVCKKILKFLIANIPRDSIIIVLFWHLWIKFQQLGKVTLESCHNKYHKRRPVGSTEVTEADEKILKFLVDTKSLLLHEKEKYICCGSILSLVQILFSFVFGYGNNV